ncbi:hypothetical protein [Cupriavidus sp. D384]|uniref:hypothetical protein n=1 Tax=Cupriavidus sp. D384 TaxID=1538095 RepID=UPI0018D3BA56|nr:hypothetical protein [Cupriavidus sp. D384]
MPARVREIPYDLGGTPLRDWAPCPWCYRKLYEMQDEGVVLVEMVTADEWE